MIPIIDGDVIAHLSCKNRWMNENGDRLISLDQGEYQFSKEEDEAYLNKCWFEFKKLMKSISDITFNDDYLMAVKGDENYRDTIYCDYKANRRKDPSKRNNFVPVLRMKAAQELNAVEAHGRETDDLLRIWAEQARAVGEPYVIVSVDKDLDCIPGKHYNIKKNLFYDVSELYATRFFYQQLMSGDPTDNIPGIWKCGPKTAERALLNVDDEVEMQTIVVEAYITAYGENWYDMLLSNGKMLYLQKHEHDFFSIDDWYIVSALGRPVPVAEGQVLEVPLEAAILEQSETQTPRPSPSPSPKVCVAPAPKEVPSCAIPMPDMASRPSPKPFMGSVPKKV